MAFSPREARRGDRLTAAAVNAQNAELGRVGRVRAGARVHARSGPGGLELAVSDRDGAYAFLAAGATIGPCTGTTLGSGEVTLCSRDGAALTADGVTVTVYNAGGQVSGGASGRVVKLSYADGDWSLDVARCS